MKGKARKILKEERDKRRTFTKVAVKALLVFGIINASMPFILSACGRESVTELGVAWLAEIVGVFAIYAFKAYFETKQQAKQELEERKQEFEEMKVGMEEYKDE